MKFRISHSDFKENYTCDTYHGDECGKKYPYTCKAIAYEIDTHFPLDNEKPVVVWVTYLQIGQGACGGIVESYYNTFGYLKGYSLNDVIRMNK